MSIQRIESIYATFMDRTDITPTQMSVLLALGYCANGQKGRNESCFPSRPYLAQLTHFGPTTVDEACKAMRAAGWIDWTSGGINRSNHYTFGFDLCRMPSRHESYQQLSTESVPKPSLAVVPPPGSRGATPQQPGGTPRQPGSNTERTRKELGIECGGDPRRRADGKKVFREPVRDASEILKSFSIPSPREAMAEAELKRQAKRSLVQEAMRVCGVDDRGNVQTFSFEMCRHDPAELQECIYTFESELRAGEHRGVRNRAALLMSRIKALPAI